MTENTFKSGMLLLMKMFGYKLDNEMVSAYWNILKNIPDDDFLQSQSNLLKTFIPTSQVPFPTIAHFMQSLGVAGQSRTKLAINALIKASGTVSVYNTISFGDPALHETIDRFGGWPTVASWTQEDWRYNEKNFSASYEASLISGTGPSKCLGIAEYENGGKVFEGKKLEFAEKQKEVKLVHWKGFDENTLSIEHKNKNDDLLSIGIDLNSIGKKME